MNTYNKEITYIFQFLNDIRQNNNRQWFQEHKEQYISASQYFAHIVEELLEHLSQKIPELSSLAVSQTLYRFYRDTRFSTDKRPYKTHFGAFMNAHGKKSFHGGYYFHLEPQGSMIAGGSYCCPPQVLRAVRNSIFNDAERYGSIINHPDFAALYPVIGMEQLKTAPKGFPKDWEYIAWLRPKNYSVCANYEDSFFLQNDWIERLTDDYICMKPFIDFVNETVDDYL